MKRAPLYIYGLGLFAAYVTLSFRGEYHESVSCAVGAFVLFAIARAIKDTQ